MSHTCWLHIRLRWWCIDLAWKRGKKHLTTQNHLHRIPLSLPKWRPYNPSWTQQPKRPKPLPPHTTVVTKLKAPQSIPNSITQNHYHHLVQLLINQIICIPLPVKFNSSKPLPSLAIVVTKINLLWSTFTKLNKKLISSLVVTIVKPILLQSTLMKLNNLKPL